MTPDERVDALAEVLRAADDEVLVRTNFEQLTATYDESARAILASPALRDLLASERAAALRLVRQVEADMSEQAFKAWRSADARRGLSDHEVLLAHADALTRWSERFRMAFDGHDYRADREVQP